MKFVYPLKGDNYDEKQTKARFGNFPISSFNTWHGGIHLEGTKKQLVAIANGRVIAYKIPDNYTDVCVDDITQQYSNGYILIQHDYKSTEGQELRFYSLYHHILPISEMGDTTPFPSFLGKTTAVVNKKEGWPVEGLNARISNGTAVNTTCDVKLIIPKGATVTLDPSENDSKLQLGNYVRIIYTDKNNIDHNDIYIYRGNSQVKDLTDTTLEIITAEDKDEDKTVLGARVRKEGKGSADIVKIIPFEEEIILDPSNKSTDKWMKLADNSGYIFKTSIKTTTVFDESKAKKNTVVACDILVKAGDLIGYVGKFGFTKHPSYDTCHFEIFTDANAAKVQDFLSNKKKDGKEDKAYYRLASGAQLKPNLESKLSIPKDNRFKCLQIKGNYVKIKVIAQSESLLRADLNGHGKKTILGKSKYQYTIKKDKVATVNAIFGHSFDTTTKLYFGGNVTGDSTRRKILYIPDLCNKIYWVHKDNFSGTYKKNDEGYSDNAIDTVFLDAPVVSKENPITVEKAIPKIKVLKTKVDTKKKSWLQISCTYEKDGKKTKKQGWISQKDSKLEQINPFNWEDFNFHLLDAGNQYVYEVEGFNKLENTCDFVTEVWNILDEDGDKIINHQELQRAYRSDIKLEKLSKLICTHKNEWSYDAATIRSEAEQYFDIGINEEEDPNKKQLLEDKKCALLDALETKMTQLMWWQEVQSAVYTPPPPPPPKPDSQLVKNDNSQALIAKKQEEQRVEALQAPLVNGGTTIATPTHELTEVPLQDTSTLEAESKNTTVTPPTVSKKEEKNTPQRAIPSTDIVHHFHPIGFIRQMRLIYGAGGAENNSEAKIRAFMRLIKEFEGVPGEEGYTTLFGKKDFFSDMSVHPEKPIYWYTKADGTKVHSTAAGSYQIMKETWWDYNGWVVKDHKKTEKRNENRNFVKKYGIKDFSPKSQDEFCIALLLHSRPPKSGQKGLLNDLLNGFVTRAIETYASYIWASFSPGRFPDQGPTKHAKTKQDKRDAIHRARMKQLELFDKFLAEELEGTTDLHLEAGFLKRFGIKEPEPQEPIENKKEGLDLNKVIKGLNKRASAPEKISIIGKCAKYVRLALEDGGMSTNGRPNAAADYISFLPKKGFKEVPDGNYQKGDIAVFERFQGVNKYHKYGHIQMYNGETWVSDFFQTGFWAGSDYRLKKPNYKIFRWE